MAGRSGYLDLPNVQEHIRNASAWAAEHLRESIIQECQELDDRHVRPVESPIEAIFQAWWIAYDRTQDPSAVSPEAFPQYWVTIGEARYRLDFEIWPKDPGLVEKATRRGLDLPKIGIELDGHEFHERTREQVSDRNKKDRDLQQAGWRIFHFSGSELHHDPLSCVREVYAAGAEAALGVYRRVLVAERRDRTAR